MPKSMKTVFPIAFVFFLVLAVGERSYAADAGIKSAKENKESKENAAGKGKSESLTGSKAQKENLQKQRVKALAKGDFKTAKSLEAEIRVLDKKTRTQNAASPNAAVAAVETAKKPSSLFDSGFAKPLPMQDTTPPSSVSRVTGSNPTSGVPLGTTPAGGISTSRNPNASGFSSGSLFGKTADNSGK